MRDFFLRLKKTALSCSVKKQVLLVFFVFAAFSCSKNQTHRIGFAASVSGKEYLLGVDGRNAAMLAVSEVNEAGGIAGKKVELLVEDFQSDTGTVIKADTRLLNKNVIAIVGHYTSTAALEALEFANREKIVLISPAASSDILSNKDDYFFRTIMGSSRDGDFLAYRILQKDESPLLVIRSNQNKVYTDMYVEAIKNYLPIAYDLEFSDNKQIDFKFLKQLNFKSILVIASSMDSGIIAQGLRISGMSQSLYLSGWSGDDDLIVHGGKAVENAVFVHQVDESKSSLDSFKKEYKRIYGTLPSFGAIETYEAMCLLFTAMRNGGTDRISFYREIKKIREITTPSGVIKFNEFGDAFRPIYYKRVSEGGIVIDGVGE